MEEVAVVKLIRLSLIVGVLLGATAVAAVAGTGVANPGSVARSHTYARPSKHAHIDCAWAAGMCTEVQSRLSRQIFGHYVGHDEPSVLFDSKAAGSGNHMQYNVTLPTDPPATNPNQPGKSFEFQLSGADWLGMAMCDTQSYPEQVHFCPPDSDRNILDPSVSPKHVGQAYMEMQFYPPGWVPWPTWQVAVGASSCSATQWCAALNIDSLSLNPVTGQMNNKACQKKVGEEYINFAFITKNGHSTGPANPLDSTTAGTWSPHPKKDLFMNSGDHLRVRFSDTANGLNVKIHDLTTGGFGQMTASKANGFGQIKFAPSASSCKEIPYNFHPMYKTSTPQTRVTWAAGSYNVAFDTEIGHFQFCHGPKKIPATKFGLLPNGTPTSCPKANSEAAGTYRRPDSDDIFCFPGSEALRYKVPGCTYSNIGFDGASYQKLWPNGNVLMHPTPFTFSSPTTGPNYNQQYGQAALETDLPAIEVFTCNVFSGKGCTRIPTTDQGKPAAFYPFYSIKHTPTGCVWQFGGAIPGNTNYGGSSGYGPLLGQTYTKRGSPHHYDFEYQDFKKFLKGNPCT
jgi:hypothetical protein